MIPGINNNTVFFDSFKVKPNMDIKFIRLWFLTQVLKAALDTWQDVRECIQKQAKDAKKSHESLQERVRREKGIQREVMHRKAKLGLNPQTAPVAIDGNPLFFYHKYKA
jgi:hypothetical protein